MTKCYIVMKVTWSDFDMPFETPVNVYTNKVDATGDKNRLNNSLTEDEKSEEIEYTICTAKFKG